MKVSLLFSYVVMSTLLLSFAKAADPDSTCTSTGECRYEFKRSLSALANSPLECNILGRQVVFECAITVAGGVNIYWYFTRDVSEAGQSAGNRIPNHPSTTRGSSDAVSRLTIDNFNGSHNGYYWCERDPPIDQTSCAILPSLVVSINANYTLDELAQCTETEFNFFGPSTRCADGHTSLRDVNVVKGVEFRNITIVTTNTNENSTSATTDNFTNVTNATETITTILEMEVSTEGAGGSNVVRTAVIWFSVGAVALILIVVAIILCAVAIAKN